jgi:hypothetical protein
MVGNEKNLPNGAASKKEKEKYLLGGISQLHKLQSGKKINED